MWYRQSYVATWNQEKSTFEQTLTEWTLCKRVPKTVPSKLARRISNRQKQLAWGFTDVCQPNIIVSAHKYAYSFVSPLVMA